MSPVLLTDPVLTYDAEPASARAVALVLHGGRSLSTAATRANQLAVLRMKPFASSLVRAGADRSLAVATLRFRVRGWNGTECSPVADTRWALDRIAERYGDVPVGLVGHSMGGRTAMYAAGYRTVRSVVGLAPWIEPGDPIEQLTGRHVLVVHGDRDRMTSPPASLSYAQSLQPIAAAVGYVSLQRGKHAMLQRPGLWHELATGFTLATLLDVPPNETTSEQTANILVEATAGRSPVVA